MTIVETSLSNGIPLLAERMPHVRSVAFGVWIASGSRHETAPESGISHFLEHMLFKGTTRRSAEQIAREVDSIGGHLDAFTGKELVGYTIKVLDEHLPSALDVVADLVLNPLFDPADLDKEKGVILEELKMELDNPEYVIHESFMAQFWLNHALGAPIIGTKRNIKGFTPARVADYHARIYQPDHIVLTAAGNLEPEELKALSERYFGHLTRRPSGRVETTPQIHAPFVRQKKRLQQVQLCLGTPASPVTDPRRFAWYVLNTLLGGGMSSRLFQNIRERQGLAYSVYSELNLYQDTGCLAIYAGTSKDSARQVISSVLAELGQLVRDPVPADDLRRAKDHMKGSLTLSLESTSSRMANLARQYLHHQRLSNLDETLNQIEAVTADEIQLLAKEFFQPGRIGLGMLGPVDAIEITAEDLVC